MADIRIGISGWRYPPWRGTFYPKAWPQKRELEYASRHLRSIEINGSFYSLQRPSSYLAWHEGTPEDFVFSVKGPRFITHVRRLKDAKLPLANFFASGVLRLGQKLGPILWQLPPSLKYDGRIIPDFLESLPTDTGKACGLAAEHDEHLKGERVWLKTDAKRPLRHAMEVRHESFRNEEFVGLLRKHHVALVVADTAGKWPQMEDVTAGFIYVRLHGDEKLYASGYSNAALETWGQKIKAWTKGGNCPKAILTVKGAPDRVDRDVYVYFDNDVKVRAPFDAMTLAERLGVGAGDTRLPKPGGHFSKGD